MKCHISDCNEDANFINVETVIPIQTLEVFSQKFKIQIPFCTIHAVVYQSSENSSTDIEKISN